MGQKEEYLARVKALSPRSKLPKNCLCAFLVGGVISAAGEAMRLLFMRWGLSEDDAGVTVTVALIALSALLTGIGVYDNLAKIGGAGTLVPVTGFANAVVSPAIDNKSEGWIGGVGAKIFTVAGPVLLYGTLAGTLLGLYLQLYAMLGGAL